MAGLYEEFVADEVPSIPQPTEVAKPVEKVVKEDVQPVNAAPSEATTSESLDKKSTEEIVTKSEDDKAALPAKPEVSLIFVGGIAWATTEAGLKMYFETFGEVKHIDFKRGFAFVHFASSEAVLACTVPGVEHLIDGRVVEVKVSEPHLASKSSNQHYNKNFASAMTAGGNDHPHSVGNSNSSDPNEVSSVANPAKDGAAFQNPEGMTQAQLDELHSSDAPGMNVGRKVFVGGLSQEVREAELRQLMQHHGNIEDVVVMMDKYTKRSRGFGFVTFTTRAEAETASRNRRQILGGKSCEVKLYEPGAKGHFYHARAAAVGPPGVAPYEQLQQQPPQYQQPNDWNRHRPFNNNYRAPQGNRQDAYYGGGGGSAPYYQGGNPAGRYGGYQQPWQQQYDYSQQQGWYGGAGAGPAYGQQPPFRSNPNGQPPPRSYPNARPPYHSQGDSKYNN